MADLLAIRQALADQLNTLDMVEADEMRISTYMLANPLQVAPVVEVFPEKFTYDAVSFETDELRFKVRALIGSVLEESAQRIVDDLLDTAGENSIKAVLESDRTLDGLVDDVTVEQSTGYRTYPVELPGVPTQHMLGCEWTVCVIADR